MKLRKALAKVQREIKAKKEVAERAEGGRVKETQLGLAD